MVYFIMLVDTILSQKIQLVGFPMMMTKDFALLMDRVIINVQKIKNATILQNMNGMTIRGESEWIFDHM